MEEKKARAALEVIFGIGPDEGEQLRQRWDGLTARDKAIVEWIVKGHSVADVAVRLGASQVSISGHAGSVARKLGVAKTGVAKVYFYLRLAEELQAGA